MERFRGALVLVFLLLALAAPAARADGTPYGAEPPPATTGDDGGVSDARAGIDPDGGVSAS